MLVSACWEGMCGLGLPLSGFMVVSSKSLVGNISTASQKVARNRVKIDYSSSNECPRTVQ
jgi:hypothetical protein